MRPARPSTFVKSFFAQSVQAAMEQARAELGSDALLLDSREAPEEARHLGEYEVVFAASTQAAAVPLPAPAAGMEELRRQMAEIREMLQRMIASPADDSDGLVAQRLMEAGVEPVLAREIEARAYERWKRRHVPTTAFRGQQACFDPRELAPEISEELSDRITLSPEIGRITALVGPPGSGKTTTLVKLAVTYGLARGHAVRLISVDTQRIGGAEQLRTYANILGTPFQAVQTAAALMEAVDSAPASALILIDTPGYCSGMLEELGGGLAQFLVRRQDIDTHLVLTASMARECVYRAVHNYRRFRPAKLLFTRLDEASSLGTVFSVAASSKIPVSFLAGGQSVPEDLAPATKQTIIESLVRQLPLTYEAAA